MPQPPCLSAQFTLLYGDPGSAAERQYLQPLYGLTLPPQPQNPTGGNGAARIESPLSAASPVSAASPGSPNSATSASSPATRRPPLDLTNTGLFPELPPEGMGPQPVFGGCFLAPLKAPTGKARPHGAPGAFTHFHPDSTPSLLSVLQDNYERKSLSEVRRKFPCPSARSGHVFLSCPEKKCILLHGGLEDVSYNDTWVFDPVTYRWRELACTAQRQGRRPGSGPHTTHHSEFPRGDAEEEGLGSDDADVDPHEQDGAGSLANEDAEEVDLMPPCAFGQAGSLYHCYDDVPVSGVDQAGHQHGESSENTGHKAAAASALCMLITGGIQENDECNNRSFSLNLDTLQWSVLELTTELPEMWGSVAETVTVKRRRRTGPCSTNSSNSNRSDQRGKKRPSDEEEEVVVVFGGMDGKGSPVGETFLLHLEKKLTEQEVFADPDFYLQCIGYDETAMIQRFLETRKEQQENAELEIFNTNLAHDASGNGRHTRTTATAAAGAPAPRGGDNARMNPDAAAAAFVAAVTAAAAAAAAGTNNNGNSSSSTNPSTTASPTPNGDEEAKANRPTVTPAEIASFRVTHKDTLADWRKHTLKTRLVGKYLVEVLPPTPGLPGRRRASSCVYKKAFVFLFGGRDDYGYYNDFWAFNAEVRRWVQIRDEVPMYWLGLFFSQPENDSAAVAIANINEQIRAVRSDPEKNEKNNPNFTEKNKLKLQMFLKQYIHDNLYSSPLNSTAKARTGSVMFIDEGKNCLYVFGGFTLSKGQLWTFCDVHAYFIDFHCWRRVSILPSRPFDLRCVEDPEYATDGQQPLLHQRQNRSNVNAGQAHGPNTPPNPQLSDPSSAEDSLAASNRFSSSVNGQAPVPIIRRVSPFLDATLQHNGDNVRLAQHSAMYESDDPLLQTWRRTSGPSGGVAAMAGSTGNSIGGGSQRRAERDGSLTLGNYNGTTTPALRIKDVAPMVCSFNGDVESIVGMTVMRYARTYLSSEPAAADEAPAYPPQMVACRYKRFELLSAGRDSLHENPNSVPDETEGFAVPVGGGGNTAGRHAQEGGRPGVNPRRTDFFQLPIMAPEARTMAAVAPDPLNYFRGGSVDSDDDLLDAGGVQGGEGGKVKTRSGGRRSYAGGEVRFFLHGGRAGEEPRGDLLEVRVRSVNKVDFEYHQTTNLLNRWVLEQEQTNVQQHRQWVLSQQQLLQQQLQGQAPPSHSQQQQQSPQGVGAAGGPTAAAATASLDASLPGAATGGVLPTTAPAMNTLNSPSNPNLNPMHPPTATPLSTDRRLNVAYLADLHTRCSAAARQRLLHEQQKRDEEEAGCVVGCNANPYVPHGRYEGGDATDAYCTSGSEKRRPGSLFLAAFGFLRQLVDFPVRHSGDTLTCREFRRNVETIDPVKWDDPKRPVDAVVARHFDVLHSSEGGIGLLARRLVTPNAAIGEHGRSSTVAAPSAAVGFSALAALASTTVESPPLSPVVTSLNAAQDAASRAQTHGARNRIVPTAIHSRSGSSGNSDGNQRRGPGPDSSLPSLPSCSSPAGTAAPTPSRPCTHRLSNAHVQLHRLLQLDPFYYSGVSYTQQSTQQLLPQTGVIEALTNSTTQGTTDTAAFVVEANPQAARTMAASLPNGFLTKLTLVGGDE